MDRKRINIVSGLPRSGTSMMMKMLEAGGLEPLSDNLRVADEDNPKGYYEFERAKKLETNKEWLYLAEGKVVKLISQLLFYLPDARNYKVVFMLRNLDEVLASQKRMIIRRGEKSNIEDLQMIKIFKSHLIDVKEWLESKKNIDVIYIDYNDTVTDATNSINELFNFFGNINKKNMLDVIDKSLYRNKIK